MPTEVVIHWPFFIGAILMLCFPRQLLRSGTRLFKRRRRHKSAIEQFADKTARDPDDKTVHLAREFANKRNYLDLLRAFAGSYSLVHFSLSIAERTPGAVKTFFFLQLFVCLAGALIQFVRHEEKIGFFAPVFYFVGLSAGLCEWFPALFAFLLVVAINPVLPNPRVFLAAYGLLLLPLGYLFGADRRLLIAGAVLVWLPPLVSVLSGKPLVIYSKKTKPA